MACKCLFTIPVASCFAYHLDNPMKNKLYLLKHLFHLYLLLDILSQCFTVRKSFKFEIACFYIQACDEIEFNWTIL